MSKEWERIEKTVVAWIERQEIFFVASAPLAADGNVNLSPKGGDCLRVLDDHTLAYIEWAGSGVETISHIRENKRMTIMLCAFSGPPKIFRFYGEGEAIMRNNPEFDELISHWDVSDLRAVRSIIKLNVKRIRDACGFGVPFYEYKGFRPSIDRMKENITDDALRSALVGWNSESINGLPGITEEEINAATPDAGNS